MTPLLLASRPLWSLLSLPRQAEETQRVWRKKSGRCACFLMCVDACVVFPVIAIPISMGGEYRYYQIVYQVIIGKKKEEKDNGCDGRGMYSSSRGCAMRVCVWYGTL